VTLRRFEPTWTSLIQVRKSLINTHQQNRIHNTKLQHYTNGLDKYAKQGDTDTHLGSKLNRNNYHDYKFDLIACELNEILR
jgi:hypothetical protein